ncbi:hypothetical protein F2P81_003989 [Scophthalmus maximus]|uniref:Uncharacterized protein n=1 Tax=Scophthalmus maximus TaxID=52904 RepID=A0A6A4TPZ5_SCOMX|nr:hypothetical protein F2P81_003989 [Scophthalmus maximus]
MTFHLELSFIDFIFKPDWTDLMEVGVVVFVLSSVMRAPPPKKKKRPQKFAEDISCSESRLPVEFKQLRMNTERVYAGEVGGHFSRNILIRAMVSAELLLQVQRRRPNLPVCLHKDVDREWVVLPKAWWLHRFALVTPSLTCVRRHNRIDINPERLPPSPLTPPERCKLSAERQREGDRLSAVSSPHSSRLPVAILMHVLRYD